MVFKWNNLTDLESKKFNYNWNILNFTKSLKPQTKEYILIGIKPLG